MLEKEKLDGVIVATRCSLHATIARKVIELGIPLFLEKPVATTWEDYRLLKEIYQQHNDKTVVSFPLRMTRMVKRVKDIIDSGEAGQIEHVQAFNYVPYGGVYYHHWYRDFEETGGLFLQKATHDFDYINYILGYRPVQLYAMESRQVFGGDRPDGLKCRDCKDGGQRVLEIQGGGYRTVKCEPEGYSIMRRFAKTVSRLSFMYIPRDSTVFPWLQKGYPVLSRCLTGITAG